MDPDDLIVLTRFDNPGTAHIVKAYLENAGIPCLLSGEDSSGFQPILTSGTGGIRLFIRRGHLEEARLLLEEAGSEEQDDDPSDADDLSDLSY